MYNVSSSLHVFQSLLYIYFMTWLRCYYIRKFPTEYLAKWDRHVALKCRYQTNLWSVTIQNSQDINCTAAKARNIAPYFSLSCNNAHNNSLSIQ